MKELKGKGEKDVNGRWYLATEYGRVYEGVSKEDLIILAFDGGFHTHGVCQDS